MEKFQGRISKKKFIFVLISIVVGLGGLSWFVLYREISGAGLLNRILLSVIIAYCIMKGINERSFINPYLCFLVVPLSLFVYDVSVSSHYLVDLKQRTYSIAIYNMVMFIFGLNIVRTLRIKQSSKSWGYCIEANSKRDARNAKRMLFLGLIPTIWASAIGLPDLLTGNLSAMKVHVGSAPLSSVFGLFLYPAVLFAIRSKKKDVISIALFGLGYSLLLNFSKTTIVMMCLTLILASYEKLTQNKRWRKWFVLGLIATIIVIYYSFGIYNNIRFDYDLNEYFQKMNYVNNVSNNFFLPYMYIISPWSNVQYIMETTEVHTYGLWLLKPLLGYLQIESIFGDAFTLIPRYSAFNTYTYISVFYIDFGFWGSGVCSLLLAMLIMYVYRLFLKFGKSPLICAVYVLNVYACLMLFFNNHYLQQSYPITILIIAWLWNHFFYKESSEIQMRIRKGNRGGL